MAELIETGLEPEYNVTDLAWWEPVAAGLRMCYACRRHGQMIAQYTIVISWDDFLGVRQTVDALLKDPKVRVLATSH